ncbi:MAG: hypothetical protein Q9214_004713 [Letrouitia sp. 1 TL-2023]
MAPSGAVHFRRPEYKYTYIGKLGRKVSVTDWSDTGDEQENNPYNLAVSTLYDLCFQIFRSACCDDDRSDSCLHSCISTISMKNEFARFYLWGDDLQMDLVDRSLESADFLKRKMVQHLLQIGRLLLRGFKNEDSLYHSDMSFRKLRDILQSHPKSAFQNLESAKPHGDAFTECQLPSNESDEESEDDIAEIPTDISFRTGCLQELTPLIKICILRAKNPKSPAAANSTFTVSGPAYYYVQNIREKYENAPVQLVERLGEANWQRHVRLRQLANDYESNQDDTLSDLQPQSKFHDSGIGTMETGSIKSYSSFVSSNAVGNVTGLRVPPAPVEVKNGEPFLCNFCGLMQYKINNRVEWNQSYPNIGLSRAHLEEAHKINSERLPDEEAHLIQRKIQSRPIEQEMCHICREQPAATMRGFLKHVGRHMEKIALMALPVTDDGSEDDDSVQSEENDATHGHDTAKTQSPVLIARSARVVRSPSPEDSSSVPSSSDSGSHPKTDLENKKMLPLQPRDAFPSEPSSVQTDIKKRRSRAAHPGRCHSCNRAETPEWRRGPDGVRILCNSCCLHYAKLTRKPRNQAAEGPSNPKPKNQMQAAESNSLHESPPPDMYPRTHPSTGAHPEDQSQ